MSEKKDDLYLAGRLIQWALRPEANPNQNEEYNNLIELYLDRFDFREIVDNIANGLGLLILPDVRFGQSVVLAPKPDSAFLMKMSNYRPSSRYTADDRLLDGLIHIAIAAIVYPRAADLIGDSWRKPITVNEIETTLREIAEQIEGNNRDNPDPIEGAEGLYEAWRVYKNRPSIKEGKDGRSIAGTTRRMIEEAFEDLCRQRCFKKIGETYQPLWRYQVLIQEFAASRLYQAIQQAINAKEGD